jgi:hypothetical protein
MPALGTVRWKDNIRRIRCVAETQSFPDSRVSDEWRRELPAFDDRMMWRVGSVDHGGEV